MAESVGDGSFSEINVDHEWLLECHNRTCSWLLEIHRETMSALTSTVLLVRESEDEEDDEE